MSDRESRSSPATAATTSTSRTRPAIAGSAEPKRRKPRDRPLLIVLTGHGQGQEHLAPSGCCMRSWARGYRCGVFQFVKSGKWKVGEAKAAAALGGIDWEKMGDGWSWLVEGPRRVGRHGARGLGRGQAGDRRRSATSSCCSTRSPTRSSGAGSTLDDVVATLRDRPGFQHVVITGRDAAPELIDAADLVTEVVKVKHPMDEGIRAQQGIEW